MTEETAVMTHLIFRMTGEGTLTGEGDLRALHQNSEGPIPQGQSIVNSR